MDVYPRILTDEEKRFSKEGAAFLLKPAFGNKLDDLQIDNEGSNQVSAWYRGEMVFNCVSHDMVRVLIRIGAVQEAISFRKLINWQSHDVQLNYMHAAEIERLSQTYGFSTAEVHIAASVLEVDVMGRLDFGGQD